MSSRLRLSTCAKKSARLLEPACNSDALAEALGKLVEDGQLRAQMGVNSRLAAEQYSWESTADRYLELSDLILAKHGAQARVRAVREQSNSVQRYL